MLKSALLYMFPTLIECQGMLKDKISIIAGCSGDETIAFRAENETSNLPMPMTMEQ